MNITQIGFQDVTSFRKDDFAREQWPTDRLKTVKFSFIWQTIFSFVMDGGHSYVRLDFYSGGIRIGPPLWSSGQSS
jgi:hypothetical protein